MLFLKQSTAATLAVGPFVDATDGFTPETGLTAGTVDEIGVYKHGATALTDISGTTTFTHRAGGIYTATLSTTDTNTLGHLVLYVRDDTVCRPVKQEYMVLPANEFDSLISGTDDLEVDAIAIDGSTTAANNQSEAAQGVVTGSAIAGTLSTTQMTTNLAEATDDHYNGRVIVWLTGALAGQATDITDYTGATKLLTYTAVTEAPSAGDNFVIV